MNLGIGTIYLNQKACAGLPQVTPYPKETLWSSNERHLLDIKQGRKYLLEEGWEMMKS